MTKQKLPIFIVGEHYLDTDGYILICTMYDLDIEKVGFKWRTLEDDWGTELFYLGHESELGWLRDLKHLPKYTSPLYKAINS